MLKNPQKNTHIVSEDRRHFKGDMEILRKNQMEMLKLKPSL
jgi:hypothetical protein